MITLPQIYESTPNSPLHMNDRCTIYPDISKEDPAGPRVELVGHLLVSTNTQQGGGWWQYCTLLWSTYLQGFPFRGDSSTVEVITWLFQKIEKNAAHEQLPTITLTYLILKSPSVCHLFFLSFIPLKFSRAVIG